MATCLGGMISKLFAIKHPEYLHAVMEIGALGVSGGGHLFAKEPKFPKTKDDIKTTWFYTTVNGFFTSNDHEGLKNFLDPFQKTTWVGSDNFSSLLSDMFKTRNLVEVFLGEATTNISDKNNGHVDGTGEVKGIKTKWLAIHGTNDLFVPFSEAEALKSTLGDLCELVKLDNVGHFTWCDTLEGTTKPIHEFLKKKFN